MPRSPSGASARPSPRVLIKSLERNALHTSRIRDMVRLNGNRSSRGKHTFTDSAGVELVGIAAARTHATTKIRDMRASVPAGRLQDWSGWTMTELRFCLAGSQGNREYPSRFRGHLENPGLTLFNCNLPECQKGEENYGHLY